MRASDISYTKFHNATAIDNNPFDPHGTAGKPALRGLDCAGRMVQYDGLGGAGGCLFH